MESECCKRVSKIKTVYPDDPLCEGLASNNCHLVGRMFCCCLSWGHSPVIAAMIKIHPRMLIYCCRSAGKKMMHVRNRGFCLAYHWLLQSAAVAQVVETNTFRMATFIQAYLSWSLVIILPHAYYTNCPYYSSWKLKYLSYDCWVLLLLPACSPLL